MNKLKSILDKLFSQLFSLKTTCQHIAYMCATSAYYNGYGDNDIEIWAGSCDIPFKGTWHVQVYIKSEDKWLTLKNNKVIETELPHWFNPEKKYKYWDGLDYLFNQNCDHRKKIEKHK